MPRPRTGTFEPAIVDGRPVYRGRLRLADGTKSDRFDLPADMNEKQARAYLIGLQAEEDASHAVFIAKQDRPASWPRSGRNRTSARPATRGSAGTCRRRNAARPIGGSTRARGRCGSRP
jgi:hypothetical protein